MAKLGREKNEGSQGCLSDDVNESLLCFNSLNHLYLRVLFYIFA